MNFEIKWLYPTSKNGNLEFVQTYSLSIREKQNYVRIPSFCAGVYISTLINACNVDKNVEGYLDSDAFSVWHEILGEEYVRQNFEGNSGLILYDSVTFPAFCIYKNIRTTLKDIGKALVQKNWNTFSQCSKDLLGEETIASLKRSNGQNANTIQEEIQNRITEYIANYNEVLTLAQDDLDENFYNKLRDCLKKYDDGKHLLIKEYLSPKNSNGRCFATFIKSDDHKKYVSFSGFIDAKDNRILKWLGKTKPENFVCVAEEICDALGAIFVPINLDTRKYRIYNYNSVNICQGQSLNDIITNQISRDVIGDYSCSERKIFGHFEDNTPNGALYVKLKICEKCALGLAYQSKNDRVIILHDGLDC